MYTPPVYNLLDFNFTAGYVPPIHGSVDFDFGATAGGPGRRRFLIGAS